MQLQASFVGFDGLLQVVDVDELDVKLVVEMFDLVKLIFVEGGAAEAFEFFLIVAKFVAIIPERLPPFSALGGVLRDVCLNHGRSI